jgi:DNA helicase-2/ATP-dependent DNA helicase PcrA
VIDEKNNLEQKKIHLSDSDDSDNDENDENNNNNENKINISENIIFNNGENIHNIGKIVKYGLKEFLDDLILLNNTEDLTENIHYLDSTSDGDNIKTKSDNVKLMTIHSSKGLEFNSVFVVGVEKGYYPIYHPNIKDQKKHEEEERRMFYVAITRAKRNCFISYAKKRLMGTGKVMNRAKSQFINELENRCLDFSGDYNNQDDNNFSLNKSSFSRFLFNNSNSDSQPKYQKKKYYNYNKNKSY